MKDFLKQFFRTLDREVQESDIEEHNRYLKPPKGTSTEKWWFNRMLLKYDYLNIKVNRQKEDD